MSVAYLDTHSAVFLHAGMTDVFGADARREIEAGDLLISPTVYLEFDYLFRRKKIAFDARTLLADLTTTFGISMCQLPFARVVEEALTISWTVDPFDRLIVAQASANRRAPLITRDKVIRQYYRNAVW